MNDVNDGAGRVRYPNGFERPLPDPIPTLRDVFADAVEAYGERVALRCGDAEVTYVEVGEQATALSAFLAAKGLRRDDRVALFLPNLPEFVVASISALSSGLVQVAANPLYTSRELGHQLADSGAKALVAFGPAAATWRAATAGTDVALVVTVGETTGNIGPVEEVSFAKALQMGRGAGGSVEAPSAADLALIQYTGGTTGAPKGAMLTHRNVVSNNFQFGPFIEAADPDDGDGVRVLTALPLYHVFAFAVNFLYFFRTGGTNVLVTDPRDASALGAAINTHRPTVITGVNTLFAGLCREPATSALDLSAARVAIGGGTAVQKVVYERWRDRTGGPILEGYGLSETSPVLTFNPAWRDGYRAGVGIPVLHTELSIRNADGRELPVGEVGEICARGPQVFSGYWGWTDDTKASFWPDEWFRTGDVGFCEPDGQYVISDRMKDMIIVSGFNVYPNEVEEVAARAPGVAECACVGAPSERTGEEVVLFVVPEQGYDEAALIESCRRDLAAYKVPKRVVTVDALPKSTVGKVLRARLRDALAAE